MKKLWNKIPAWLKAILLNIILLYPIMIAVQSTLVANVTTQKDIPWSVPIALLLLFGFYQLIKKVLKTDEPEDVKIRFWFDAKKVSNWSYALAMFFITPAIIMIVAYAFGITESGQRQFIESFGTLSPTVAIPVLVVLALSAGIIEELIYRAVLQNTLTRNYPKGISFLFMGVIFATLHLLPLPLVAPYILVSIMYCYIADKTKSTAVVIFGHFIVDAASFLLVYFLPSALREPTINNVLIVLAMLVIGITCLLYPTRFRISNQREISLIQ